MNTVNGVFLSAVVLLSESDSHSAIYLEAGPSNLTVLAGESVQLECAVSMPSSRDLHIIWARQGRVLQCFPSL